MAIFRYIPTQLKLNMENMDPITIELVKSGVGEAAKVLFSSILARSWPLNLVKGKGIVERFSSTKVHINYLEKHVSKAIKLRTIHSSDSDILLNDIYHPLTIENKKTNQTIKIENETIISNDEITNIIGYAGQGKSTILRKLLIESIKNGTKIPLFIELRKAEKNGIIKSLISSLSEMEVEADEESIQELLISKTVVLLLDGFDEIQSERREVILEEILKINRVFGTQVITTSRDGTEICSESNITNYRVNRLKRSDIISILKKLSASNEVEQDTLPQIYTLLRGSKGLDLIETMNSPLLVTLFYICYPHLDSIPNNATDFYSKLFTTLFLRHDKIKNFRRQRLTHLSHMEAFNCFCAFCFKSLYDGKLDFTYQTLIEYTTQAVKMTGCNGCNPELIAEEFIDITCLIQKDGYDRYVFLHKSILEYHAAEYVKSLSSTRKEQFMNVIYTDLTNNRKFTATAKYLYDIDKENTFKFICLKLIEAIDFHNYKNSPRKFVENAYEYALKDSKVVIGTKHTIKDNDLFINSIGPFDDITSAISLFTSEQDMLFLGVYASTIASAFIKKDILNIKSIEHLEKHHISDDDQDDAYYIKVTDLIDKHNLKESILTEMIMVSDKIYDDLYLKNISLIERKESALEELFDL